MTMYTYLAYKQNVQQTFSWLEKSIKMSSVKKVSAFQHLQFISNYFYNNFFPGYKRAQVLRCVFTTKQLTNSTILV